MVSSGIPPGFGNTLLGLLGDNGPVINLSARRWFVCSLGPLFCFELRRVELVISLV